MREIERVLLSQVAGVIREPKYTLILCHRNPDPDTLGSAFALKHLFEHFGSRVKVACADRASAHFDFITEGQDLAYVEDGYERVIAVDVASPKQLGSLEFLAERVDLTIDHHSMCTRFSNYYEDFGAACAEIIMMVAYDALRCFDEMPKHFYTCLYAGISGDTGCFKYSNTNYRTMKYGADLLCKGIDHAEINRLIFDCKSLKEIKGDELSYKHMELYRDGALALCMITNEIKEANGITNEDITDIVSNLRSIEGVQIAVTMKETDKNRFSISVRSNTNADVASLCAKIGGGGHPRAAGATVEGTPEDAKRVIIDLFSGAVV